MQTPPPFNRPPEGQYYQQPQKPKKNPLLIVFAVLGVLTLCCGAPLGALVFYGKKFVDAGMGVGECAINVEMMSQALKSYQAANGGKMPKAVTWQTDIAKYWKVDNDLKDMKNSPVKFNIWTPGGEWSCGSTIKTGFAFNDAFSGKTIAEATKISSTDPAIFETKKVGYNQHSKYVAIPESESPLVIESIADSHRGWFLITPDGDVRGMKGKKSKSGGAVDFNFDSSSDQSKPSKDSANSE